MAIVRRSAFSHLQGLFRLARSPQVLFHDAPAKDLIAPSYLSRLLPTLNVPASNQFHTSVPTWKQRSKKTGRLQSMKGRKGKAVRSELLEVATREANPKTRLQEVDYELPTVAIVGRPNVGKSALFNRLVGRRTALVWNTPESHVTRDVREGIANLHDLKFQLMDTAGIEPFLRELGKTELQARTIDITQKFVKHADVVLFLVDARSGLTPGDHEIARWLRTLDLKQLIVVANKCERGRGAPTGPNAPAPEEATALGFGSPVAISAETGEGMVDLYEELQGPIDNEHRRLKAAKIEALRAKINPVPLEAEEGDSKDTDGAARVDAGLVDVVGALEVGGELGHLHLRRTVRPPLAVMAHRGDDGGDSDDTPEMREPGEFEYDDSDDDDDEEYFDDDMLDAELAALTVRERQMRAEELRAARSDDDDDVDDEDEPSSSGDPGCTLQGTDIPMHFAILGLPNVGKSTLVNTLIGRERMLTGPEPGLTRDSIRVSFMYKGRRLWLVDTAGWESRTRLKKKGKVAELGNLETRRSLFHAHVVALTICAQKWHELGRLSKAERSLVTRFVKDGKGLVVVLNKIDYLEGLVQRKELASVKAKTRQLQDEVEESFPQLGRVPVVCVSAHTGKGVDKLLPRVYKSYAAWNTRLTTSRLNRWMLKVTMQHAGMGGAHGINRVKYLMQVKARPPTFVVKLRGSDKMSPMHMRAVTNALRDDFGFDGVPLRVLARSNEKWVVGK